MIKRRPDRTQFWRWIIANASMPMSSILHRPSICSIGRPPLFDIPRFYRDAKQHFGLGRCQMKSAEGTKGHWYLILLIYSLLRLLSAQHGSKVRSGEGGLSRSVNASGP